MKSRAASTGTVSLVIDLAPWRIPIVAARD
jgi:hypothetical protein